MTELEFYKDRCTKLERYVNELVSKLWGTDLHLAKNIVETLDESFEPKGEPLMDKPKKTKKEEPVAEVPAPAPTEEPKVETPTVQVNKVSLDDF